MTKPFAIPTRDDFGPKLTDADLREMLHRALAVAPNLFDDDAVVDHLTRLGFSLVSISGEYGAAIDEARANARNGRFVPLGEAASSVVAKITTST